VPYSTSPVINRYHILRNRRGKFKLRNFFNHIIPICEDIKNIPYNQLNAVPLAVQAAILIPLPGKPDLPIAIKAVLPARVFYLQIQVC